MSQQENSGWPPNYIEIGLQDYGNELLNEAGALRMGYFEHPMYVELGNTSMLEIVRIALPEDELGPEPEHRKKGLYVVHNMGNAESERIAVSDEKVPSVLIDKTIQTLGGDINYKGRFATIGRESTPELMLNKKVSREHLSLMGGYWSEFQLRDEDSTNGTRIRLNPEDRWSVCEGRRMYTRVNGEVRTTREVEGRWAR
jgi:hypothetical protein